MANPTESDSTPISILPDQTVVDWSRSVLLEIPAAEFVHINHEYRLLTGQDLTFQFFAADSIIIIVHQPPAVWRERYAAVFVVYWEWSAGIWLQQGFIPALPLPAILNTGPGSHQHFLIRSPGELWRIPTLTPPDNITIQVATTTRTPSALRPRQRINLRLRSEHRQTAPTLWIIKQDALAQLAAYLRGAIETTLAPFFVAFTQMQGQPVVLVRCIHSRKSPPVFVANAQAFSLWQPGSMLYLPQGQRLSPEIRRDVLLNAINPPPDRLSWLETTPTGWRMESIPLRAFTALSTWIDYRAPEQREHNTWEQSTRWVLEHFETQTSTTAERTKETSPTLRRNAKDPNRPGLISRAMSWLKNSAKRRDNEQLIDLPSTTTPKATSRQAERLHHARLEGANSPVDRCHQLETVLIAKAKDGNANLSQSWLELARAYNDAEKYAEASLCWLNAIWAESNPPATWFREWLNSSGKEVAVDSLLADATEWFDSPPNAAIVRAIAAWVCWAARQSPIPPELIQRAVKLQALLREHEEWLPIRAAWLAQMALAKFSRGDVLQLARTRDRLTERLLDGGVSLEIDTPPFLRFPDDAARNRHLEASQWLVDKRPTVLRWINNHPPFALSHEMPNSTHASIVECGLEAERINTTRYVNLLFGWGLMRLSESLRGAEVIKLADENFPMRDTVHQLLREAFEFRFQNMREGRSPRLPFPSTWQQQRQQLGGYLPYFVDKFLECSRVLQPNPPPSAYLATIFQKSSISVTPSTTLNRLNSFALNEQLPKMLQQELLQRGPTIELARLTQDALRRVTELRPETLDAVFKIVPTALDAARTAIGVWAGLIEHGLAAANFADRPEIAQICVKEILTPGRIVSSSDIPDSLTSQAFRSLRRLGLMTEADRVLQHIAQTVTQGSKLTKIRTNRPLEWPVILRTMLAVAAGWYYTGQDDSAYAVLEEAKSDLYDRDLTDSQRSKLALAYVHALGQAPYRVTMGRLDEMFHRLTRLNLKGTANHYCCLPILQLVEASIRAVVGDDYVAGAGGREWRDQDEVHIRRRIRDDLAEAIKMHETVPT